MSVVSLVATIVYFLLLLYFLVMWARFVLDLVRSFARYWRPKGVGLVIAEFVFAITDPPIKTVRRVLPPLRLGGIALDFAWSVVMLGVIVLHEPLTAGMAIGFPLVILGSILGTSKSVKAVDQDETADNDRISAAE